MRTSRFSIFGYNSEKSIKIYNRVLKVFLHIPLIVFILIMISYPIYIDVLKNKSLPFGSPWLFMIIYPILIGITDFVATVVHEFGHVFFGFFVGKKFHSITFLAFTIEYSPKNKKISFYHDNKRLIRDRFIAFGSVGMIPKNIKYSPFKDIIYYSGGAAFNLLTWFLLFVFYGNSILSLMMLYSGISTLIPYRYFSAASIGGADGYYVISTLFSFELREIYKAQNEAAKYYFSDIKLSSSEILKAGEILLNSPYLNTKCLGHLLLAKFYINNTNYEKARYHINEIKEMMNVSLNKTFWYDEDAFIKEIREMEDKLSI